MIIINRRFATGKRLQGVCGLKMPLKDVNDFELVTFCLITEFIQDDFRFIKITFFAIHLINRNENTV